VNALAERVMNLVLEEKNPQEAADKACLKLDLPSVDNPNQLGQVLVKDNLNLLTNLNLQMMEDPFPAQLKESSPEAEQAIQETSLEDWVSLALTQVYQSSLD
jgi:hypothetical protein